MYDSSVGTLARDLRGTRQTSAMNHAKALGFREGTRHRPTLAQGSAFSKRTHKVPGALNLNLLRVDTVARSGMADVRSLMSRWPSTGGRCAWHDPCCLSRWCEFHGWRVFMVCDTGDCLTSLACSDNARRFSHQTGSSVFGRNRCQFWRVPSFRRSFRLNP